MAFPMLPFSQGPAGMMKAGQSNRARSAFKPVEVVPGVQRSIKAPSRVVPVVRSQKQAAPVVVPVQGVSLEVTQEPQPVISHPLSATDRPVVTNGDAAMVRQARLAQYCQKLAAARDGRRRHGTSQQQEPLCLNSQSGLILPPMEPAPQDACVQVNEEVAALAAAVAASLEEEEQIRQLLEQEEKIHQQIAEQVAKLKARRQLEAEILQQTEEQLHITSRIGHDFGLLTFNDRVMRCGREEPEMPCFNEAHERASLFAQMADQVTSMITALKHIIKSSTKPARFDADEDHSEVFNNVLPFIRSKDSSLQ